MSTYTDLHTRRRENLTILRKPGAPEDGITPQRVIFANPDNIYEGTFRGKINATGMTFTDSEFVNVKINGGFIADATLCSNGQVVPITELTSQVSQLNERVDTVNDAAVLANLSCQALSAKINNVSADITNNITSILDDAFESIKYLSNEISTATENLSNEISTVAKNLSNEISTATENLSNEISAETQIRTRQYEELSARLSTDEQAFEQHVQNFNSHVEENIQTFDFLSNYALSSIEKEKHYAIVNDFKDIPYRVKEFAVNIIESGASNVQIKLGDTVIGYGTYINNTDGSRKLRIAISTEDKIPELIDVIPGSYTIDLLEGDSNRRIVGGAYFYWISWRSNTNEILFEKIDQEYYDLIETTYGTTIGKIKNAKIDPQTGNFISGTAMFSAGGEFNDFYEAFAPNGIIFNNAELSTTLKNGCLFKLNADSKSFSLGKNVATKEIREIIDNTSDRSVFGHVVVTDVSVDQGNIVKIPVSGIDLTKYGIIKCNRNAVLTEENNFYSKIEKDLVISCDIDSENVFSVVKLKEKFAYPYYKPVPYVDHHELTDAIGFLTPNQENTLINEGEFESLSVTLKVPDWGDESIISKTYECLSTSHNTYTYSEGTIGDEVYGWLKINVVKDIDMTWTIVFDGFDGIKGGKIYAIYKVDTTQHVIVPSPDTYTLIAQSTSTNVLEGEEKTFPEISYVAIVNGPRHVDGESTISLRLNDVDGSQFFVQVPAKDSKYYSTAREFIINAKITSISDKIQLKLVDGNRNVSYWSNGKENDVWLHTNMWSSLRFIEVDQNKFLVEDLDNAYLRDELEKTNATLDQEIRTRTLDNAFLSGQIDANKLEIDDLWKNIRGGLNYQGMLSVTAESLIDGAKISSLIHSNYIDLPLSTLLRNGFFYVIQTPDRNVHYTIDDIEIEHGDWFIINTNTSISGLQNVQVSIFDAQDYDVFKLSADNNIVGNNTFIGNTYLSGSLSTDGQATINGTFNADRVNVSNDVCISGSTIISGSTKIQDTLEISNNATFKSDAIVESNLSVANKTILNGELSALDNVYANRDLTVSGSTQLCGNATIGGHTTLEDVTVNKNIEFESDVLVNGNFALSGNAEIDKELSVKQNATFGNDVCISNNLSIGNDAVILGDIKIKSNAEIDKELSVKQNATFENDVCINNNISIGNDVYISNDLSVKNDVCISNNLSVGNDAFILGDIKIKSNAEIDKELSVKQNATFGNDVYISNDLSVGNDVRIAQNLSADNNAYVAQNLSVGNDAFVLGGIKIKSNSEFESDVLVSGNFALSGNAEIDKELSVKQNATFGNDVCISNNLSVGNDLSIARNIYALSNINATGDISANSKVIAPTLSAISVNIESNLSSVNAEILSGYVKNLSIDLSSVKYSTANNAVCSLQELSTNIQTQLNNAQLSVAGISGILSDALSNEVRYFGTFTEGYSLDRIPLSSFLWQNIKDASYVFHTGYAYRILADISGSGGSITIDDGHHDAVLFSNDFIVFNKYRTLSDVVWSDIDIIRDAQAEGKWLSGQVYDLSGDLSSLSGEVKQISANLSGDLSGLSGEFKQISANLSGNLSGLSGEFKQISANLSGDLSGLSGEVEQISAALTGNINYLSSELSDYHNTLSGIDRGFDDTHDIKSDNLIFTDVNLAGGTSHQHNRYYATFISGTIVLKSLV